MSDPSRRRPAKPREAKIPDFYLDPREFQRNFLKIIHGAIMKELEKMIDRWAKEGVKAIMKVVNAERGRGKKR
jgi:hypothetical protein